MSDELLATTWFDGVQYVWLSDHTRIVADLNARLDAAEQLAAGFKKDAERYRWLVDLIDW